MSKLQKIRGTQDILGAQAASWETVLGAIRTVLGQHGYGEIWLPLIERTELFKRSIGEVTDIVEKEMYTFSDRNDESLTLRPEATAGVVRAFIENGLHRAGQQRLWLFGPMFRYERPQKGRYRQFHQVNVEAYGMAGPDIDAEMIGIGAAIWRALGLSSVRLEINSLGTPESRAAYRETLIDYLRAHAEQLDEDSLRRLESNPLRVLDSKNPDMADLLAAAPKLHDALDVESRAHFDGLTARLDAMGIGWVHNPRLVRGLDYYSRTVFEWVTDDLGAQNAVCSGGRYDGLIEQLGGEATGAVGFGLGVERVVALYEQQHGEAAGRTAAQVYVAALGERAALAAAKLAISLREAGLQVMCDAGGGSLKAQLKRADRSGAAACVVLGDEELDAGTAQIKPLRSRSEQRTVAQNTLIAELARELSAET